MATSLAELISRILGGRHWNHRYDWKSWGGRKVRASVIMPTVYAVWVGSYRTAENDRLNVHSNTLLFIYLAASS